GAGMSRRVRRAVTWSLVGGVAAVIAAIVRPDDRALVLDAYLLFVGGIALLLLVRVTGGALPAAGESRFARALRPPPRPRKRPEALAALERRLLLATETAFEVHYRLRPILWEIAAYRLSAHRGIDLDAEPEAAREALAPEAWELVRPDRPSPADRLGPGCRLADLRAAVHSLERI
ncbi:MAG: hypothetical protein WD249_09115, partial [Gaiellaceae bacterium]